MRNFANYHVDVRRHTSGVVKTICEQCLPTRHNKRDRSLRVNIDTGHCHCYHCGADFYVPDDAEEREKAERQAARKRRVASAVPQHFRRPVFDASKTTLSEATERWLVETRCIPQSVIAGLRITEQEEFMSQSGAKERCVCFNYFEDGKLVNTKFRSGAKNFKMVQGAELIPYNIDSVLGQDTCIIHEGELDAASSLAAGFKSVISVPAGANANLSWLDRFMESHFENLKDIIIAVDTDSAGLKLRDELVNRLGAERCRVAVYGPGCKDANEHLVKYGIDSLRIVIEQAEEIPLEGIFTAADLHEDLRALFDNGFGPGAETGWEEMDKICTYERRRLVIVTGIPGAGKSETQYLSNFLNLFTEFATQYNCLVILVAHPRKMNRNPVTNHTPRPEMYDVNGSADFFNKADYGLVVERDKEVGVTRVYVEKVKFKHLGAGGVATFVYDPVSGRYLPCEESQDPSVPPEQRVRNTVSDSSCWLPEKELFEGAD